MCKNYAWQCSAGSAGRTQLAESAAVLLVQTSGPLAKQDSSHDGGDYTEPQTHHNFVTLVKIKCTKNISIKSIM